MRTFTGIAVAAIALLLAIAPAGAAPNDGSGNQFVVVVDEVVPVDCGAGGTIEGHAVGWFKGREFQGGGNRNIDLIVVPPRADVHERRRCDVQVHRRWARPFVHRQRRELRHHRHGPTGRLQRGLAPRPLGAGLRRGRQPHQHYVARESGADLRRACVRCLDIRVSTPSSANEKGPQAGPFSSRTMD